MKRDYYSTGLQVSPGRATRFIGDTVRLNCSDPTESLNWIHQGVNTEESAYIYSSGVGILLKYRNLGRFVVETDDSSGSCDIVIQRIEASDAGKYICRRDDGGQREIELIVIGKFILLFADESQQIKELFCSMFEFCT